MRVLKSFSFENADRVSLVVTEVVVATGVFLERKPSLSPKTIVREKGTSVAADVKGGSGESSLVIEPHRVGRWNDSCGRRQNRRRRRRIRSRVGKDQSGCRVAVDACAVGSDP